MIKVYCTKWSKNGRCSDVRIKRSLFGIGARLCVLDNVNSIFGGSCEYREDVPKPKAPPPPPKPPAKRIIRDNVRVHACCAEGTAVDALEKANKALEIAANMYCISEGYLVEHDPEAGKLVKEAGGYLQYLLKTKTTVDKAYKNLKNLT